MIDRMCSIEGCTRPYRARGWCGAHYMRWLKHGDALAPVKRQARQGEPLKWIQALAADTDGEGCRDWAYGTNGSDYGSVWYQGRQRKATHVVLALTGRIQPPGHQVLHSCDRPICCAPWHLSWGTLKENIGDMRSKGRGWWQHPHAYKRNPQSKVNLCWCGRIETDEFHIGSPE